MKWGTRILLAGCAAAIVYATGRMIAMLAATSLSDVRHLLFGAGATFLRVELTLALAALWTIPAGKSSSD